MGGLQYPRLRTESAEERRATTLYGWMSMRRIPGLVKLFSRALRPLLHHAISRWAAFGEGFLRERRSAPSFRAFSWCRKAALQTAPPRTEVRRMRVPRPIWLGIDWQGFRLSLEPRSSASRPHGPIFGRRHSRKVLRVSATSWASLLTSVTDYLAKMKSRPGGRDFNHCMEKGD